MLNVVAEVVGRYEESFKHIGNNRSCLIFIVLRYTEMLHVQSEPKQGLVNGDVWRNP